MRIRRGPLLLAFLLALGPLLGREPELGRLDAYLAAARRQWGVPGLAVAIVHEGRVVLLRGYGVRRMEKPDPVDPDTLFAIASNTKAFTTAALAMLVEQGKLSWDDPVRRYLPGFQLYSPYVSQEMRVRDLLCHRSGLGTFSGDLLWYQTRYTPQDILRRIRFLKPAGPFRAHYGYSNVMFIVAGQVLEAAAGTSWGEFIRDRILRPLGMRRTLTSVRELAGVGNVATPHGNLDGPLQAYPWAPWDAAAAAGGILSSARDMSRWLLLQLGRGRLGKVRLFSPHSSRTLWSPQLFLPLGAGARLHPSTHFRAYGLGWGLLDYRGHKVIQHGGAYDGMFSRVVLVPEERLGMVLLTNSTSSLQTALAYRILDTYLGAPPRDWSRIYLERDRRSRQRRRRRWQKVVDSRHPGTRPSFPLEAYTGRYGGDLYGDATVRLEGGHLVLGLLPAPRLSADLSHWHYDTFLLTWRHRFPWFDRGTVQFVPDSRGRVKELRLEVPNDDFWFQELQFQRKP